jgi:hypothetical protein
LPQTVILDYPLDLIANYILPATVVFHHPLNLIANYILPATVVFHHPLNLIGNYVFSAMVVFHQPLSGVRYRICVPKFDAASEFSKSGRSNVFWHQQ